MQSSGKSCVLKIACYCSWVEKRLELTQKINGFGKGSTFIDTMADYYKMFDYIQDSTYIEYETRHLKFSYDHSSKLFEMKWKSKRWEYKRPKISYIPADRNVVAAIPGWSSLSMDGNMIEFMSDWDKARRFVKKEENFLDLGMSYSYDSISNSDKIQLNNGKPLMLRESSSGVQSLLPMYVHLDYLVKDQYKDSNGKISYDQKEERRNLLSTMYKRFKNKEFDYPETVTIEGYDYNFASKEDADRFKSMYYKYISVDHSEIFLEEPEDNLFPPTQCKFVNWLLDAIEGHNDMLFIATHSPYVLNQLIKVSSDEISVFFTYHSSDNTDRLYRVRQLSKEEIREIYDNGVDMFFNFELYL
jgi:hypothetical protein